MDELIVKRKTKYGYHQTTVNCLNWMKIILLIMLLYSIYETAILIVWVPDDFRFYSSWYMRRSRLFRIQDEEIWFKPVIVIALALQAIEFIAILMEIVNLVIVFCFIQFFATAYRFERARYDFQYVLASVWILINLTYLFYLVLLYKLYRHAHKLDRYAYRIPTPEISTYNICGEKRTGVYVKSY